MNIPTLEVQSSQLQRTVGDAYLKLQLNQQISAVLSMAHVQEALAVPVGRITLMPNMPACVLGLLNQRSQVLWIIDLPQMLDLPTLDTEVQHYSIAIIRVGSIPLGLVVQEVKGVMRFSVDSIQSPIGAVAPSLVPYLRGCILQSTEVLLVLDAEAIANSPLLHSNESLR